MTWLCALLPIADIPTPSRLLHTRAIAVSCETVKRKSGVWNTRNDKAHSPVLIFL